MGVLTSDERAAIDAYSGPVTKVANGVSGLPRPRWCPDRNQLVLVLDEGLPLTKPGSRRRGAFKKTRRPLSEQQRATMVEMVNAGAQGTDIGRAIGINADSAYYYITREGLRDVWNTARQRVKAEQRA